MDEVERVARRVADAERAITDQLARTGPLVGRASSPDGAVEVVTAPGGPPLEVRISRAALSMGADGLAAEILRVAERAAAAAGAVAERALAGVAEPGGLVEAGIPVADRRDDEDFGDGSYLRGTR
ncbi:MULTISPECIES: hypothetical protein [Actinosynnema]|uniref:YbaB/EbfC family DNA-binding protein n=1 Tax=Actinosynnema pretiosum TaxID=42197 RepID=A0A290ZE53_9PSEU|nr:hypothetical protein [Actinosynnema pretiosum]ATE57287.1 hypothetical protein CNX65_31610 [Actinosynnema pretiosum]